MSKSEKKETPEPGGRILTADEVEKGRISYVDDTLTLALLSEGFPADLAATYSYLVRKAPEESE